MTLALIYFSDVEDRIKEIQSRKMELSLEENGVNNKKGTRFGDSEYYDQDMGEEGCSKLSGYVTSIAANDDVDVSCSKTIKIKAYFFKIKFWYIELFFLVG